LKEVNRAVGVEPKAIGGNDGLLRELLVLRDECSKLEPILGKLNFFRAVGAARAEVRHSDFLAFLLNPREAHGLHDSFLRTWLEICLTKAQADPKLRSEATRLRELVGASGLADTQVSRETPVRIDVFILNENLEFAVIVENKTDSVDSETQLPKYWQAIEKEYPHFERFGFYLSPRGARAQHDNDHNYFPIGYDTLCEALDHIFKSEVLPLNSDIKVLLEHYYQLIKDEFMKNEQGSDIAWDVYLQFPNAVAFIRNNSPGTQISEKTSEMIREADRKGLVFGRAGAKYTNFALSEWMDNVSLRNSEGLTTGWLFWFDLSSGLSLWLGADKDMEENVTALRQLAKSRTDLFPPTGIDVKNDDWPTVWSRPILKDVDLRNMNRRQAFETIDKAWNDFLDNDLPRLREACAQALATRTK
jgi:hypothetical protein